MNLIQKWENSNFLIFMMYPSIDDPDFSKKISRLAEFTYLDNPYNFFPYQEFVRRFMSPYTPYTHLILYHGLGSGKTIASLSVAIDHYKYSKKKTIIVTKGDSAENNFRNQIKKYSELAGYVPDPKIFSFYHYIQLSNILKGNPEYRDLLSNKVVIMDEVHNLKDLEAEGTLDTICKAIDRAVNSKFIFATATPMVDSIKEIVSLLRLTGRKLSTNSSKEEVIQNLRGVISYSEISLNKPNENIIWNIDIDGTKYYASYFQGSQLEHYKKESLKGIVNMYRSLVDISLFCFPNGITGRKINEECMYSETITVTYESYHEKFTSVTYKNYKLKDEYKNFIRKENLINCSAIYNTVINIITNTEKGKIFIFSEFVHGSGILLLTNILEEYGYSLYEGGIVSNLKKGKRYTLCVGNKEIVPNISERIDGFNDDLNEEGDYIQILVGSRVIGESVSLLNVKQFHFISPHWNESYLNQSKGRVFREGSHKIKSSVIDVYVHLSLLKDGSESIDEYKIKTCNFKRKKIVEYTQYMQDNAVDRYVYSKSKDEQDIRTLVALYSKTFLPKYMNDIARYPPCTVEYICSNINLPYPELTIEMIRLMIVNNYSFGGKYLRASPYKLYWVKDNTIPFYSFKELNKENYFLSSKTFDISLFRYLSLHDKIKCIENAFIIKDKDFLKQIPTLFMKYKDKYYHFLHYKDTDKAYIASSIVPSKPGNKTRVFANNKWCTVIENEKEILALYKDLFQTYVNKTNEYPVFGFISVIDGKTRIRKKQDTISDARKIYRGIALTSVTKEELKIIASSINCPVNDNFKKEDIIKEIEGFMFSNGYFAYF